jgi:hypothetical protein
LKPWKFVTDERKKLSRDHGRKPSPPFFKNRGEIKSSQSEKF